METRRAAIDNICRQMSPAEIGAKRAASYSLRNSSFRLPAPDFLLLGTKSCSTLTGTTDSQILINPNVIHVMCSIRDPDSDMRSKSAIVAHKYPRNLERNLEHSSDGKADSAIQSVYP